MIRCQIVHQLTRHPRRTHVLWQGPRLCEEAEALIDGYVEEVRNQGTPTAAASGAARTVKASTQERPVYDPARDWPILT